MLFQNQSDKCTAQFLIVVLLIKISFILSTNTIAIGRWFISGPEDQMVRLTRSRNNLELVLQR